MRKGAASGRAGRMDERRVGNPPPESHVRSRCFRGTGGPSRAQVLKERDRANLFVMGNQCSGPNRAYLRAHGFLRRAFSRKAKDAPRQSQTVGNRT